ncbi:hypothetical protein B0T24DRAFT_632700 [Lasiosphaeria ovina]|uniref:Uncharacterized protein n=1 Tax=Lasiosphaeria ovina TaxID=92902 RepID=A0AAE0K3K6_9PEZI|nr:hypothetical protein B0T24DRAFT_632700 [Lasiosphaeria ovina]
MESMHLILALAGHTRLVAGSHKSIVNKAGNAATILPVTRHTNYVLGAAEGLRAAGMRSGESAAPGAGEGGGEGVRDAIWINKS